MLTVHAAYPKIHFRIIRAVNPLSQSYINRKSQKSVSIYHCDRVPSMNTLFIAFKSDELRHFAVRVGSAALTSFYCVCVVSFYFSLFQTILIIKQ